MHRQPETRARNHRTHTRTRNASLPTQANHTARGARKHLPNQGTQLFLWVAGNAVCVQETAWCAAPTVLQLYVLNSAACVMNGYLASGVQGGLPILL